MNSVLMSSSGQYFQVITVSSHLDKLYKYNDLHHNNVKSRHTKAKTNA